MPAKQNEGRKEEIWLSQEAIIDINLGWDGNQWTPLWFPFPLIYPLPPCSNSLFLFTFFSAKKFRELPKKQPCSLNEKCFSPATTIFFSFFPIGNQVFDLKPEMKAPLVIRGPFCHVSTAVRSFRELHGARDIKEQKMGTLPPPLFFYFFSLKNSFKQ